jgi:hypothetical protein
MAIGADELVGDGVPHAQLDLLAVEQHQPGTGRQRGVGGDGVEEPGFPAARLAAGAGPAQERAVRDLRMPPDRDVSP